MGVSEGVVWIAVTAAFVAGSLWGWWALWRLAGRAGAWGRAGLLGWAAAGVAVPMVLSPWAAVVALTPVALVTPVLAPLLPLAVPRDLAVAALAPAFAAALAAGLALAWRPETRAACGIAAVAAGGIAAFLAADVAARRAMCTAAAAHGIEAFHRRSVFASWLSRGEAGPTWSVHAGWDADGSLYAWSYMRRDFRRMPDRVAADLPPDVHHCA